MNNPLPRWREVDESDIRCWVSDLDSKLYSVDHRRLCVWQDEFDRRWHWELETFTGSGDAAHGTEANFTDAQSAAERAAVSDVHR